jgi:hypothetical protein
MIRQNPTNRTRAADATRPRTSETKQAVACREAHELLSGDHPRPPPRPALQAPLAKAAACGLRRAG